ncbi:MAG: peptide/nickel transport system substrate-binding protein [Thermomicrobiales bacterium]|jgi:peptide/nickel transport system substrate-binding protein|nr:peptide/nickel transport system substrate-binding protein [Thermomicrobiales bacterium]
MDRREAMAQALDHYLKSGFSRRALMRASLAAGGLAALTPLAGAATGDRRAIVSATAQDTAWAEAPVKFVWVDYAEPTSIDPALVQDTNSFTFARNVYEPLVEIDPAKLELIPALATEWTISEDGKTYTLTLREGVKFHGGNDFTAADVKATLDRVKAINQGPAFLVANVGDVAVVDPRTVTITTDEPDPFLPAHLVKIGIVSAKTIAEHVEGDDNARAWFADNADGTGPYKLDSYEKGSQINLVKNADWWRGWQPGSIDEIAFRWAGETSTRVQMLERGEADLIGWVPPAEAQRVGQSEGFTLVPWQTFDTDPAIYVNTQKAPTDNVKFRQALAAAFNYQAVVDYNQGFASIPTGPVPPDFPGGAQDLQPFVQDLAKAQQLLQESGVDAASTELDFVVPSSFASFAFGATVFQESAQQLGIKVNIREMPWAQMLELYKNPEDSPHVTDFAQSPFGLDPIQFVGQFYVTGAVYNMANYSNPEVDAMVAQAKTTVDEAARNKILADIQHKVVADAVNIWTCRPQTLDAVPNHVTGYIMDPTDYRWATKFYLIRIKQK